MDDSDSQPPAPGGAGYWFTPVPIYLIEASIDPESPVNGPAIVLWAHLHRHYAWRKRMFPAHGTLAKETGQSDSAIRRQLNALRDAGALTWGAKYSQKGRTSNDYALALQRPFEFDREIGPEVTVKNDSHPPVTVKSDGGVEVKNDRHPTVKNERVVEEHRVSKRSLSSRVPQQATEPSAAPDEREINQDEQMVLAAYTGALGRKPTTAVVRRITEQTAKLIADGLPAWWIAGRAKELGEKGWTDLTKHCERSTVPVETVRPADVQKVCDRGHSKFDPMIRDPERGLVNCPDCHPAEIARRQRQGAA